MAQVTLTVGVHRKWWVMPSLYMLSALCKLTGWAPDLEGLATWYGVHGFNLVIGDKRIRLGCL